MLRDYKTHCQELYMIMALKLYMTTEYKLKILYNIFLIYIVLSYILLCQEHPAFLMMDFMKS
jgi:hypothetical protein